MWGIYVPLFRDLHPACARCRGVRCTADVTCDICKDWSVAQWEAFLEKRPYNSHRKHRPSGSSLPSAPQTNPPCASSSSEAGHPVPPPPPRSLPLLLRGLTARGVGGGVWRVPLARLSLPLPSRWRVGWGEAPRVLWLLGARGIRLPLPSRGRGSRDLRSPRSPL